MSGPRKGKVKRIGILGAFGQQNLGNECTLAAFLNSCRKHVPEAEVFCICTDPAVTTAEYDIPAIPLFGSKKQVWPKVKNPVLKWARRLIVYLPREIRHWFVAFRALANTKVLFVPGTGLLTDAYQSSFGLPYTVFKWSVVAKFCRCKTMFVSVGAGPLDRPLSRWFIKTALSGAEYRSYRDKATKECILGLGFAAEHDPLYPDLVFSMPVPESLSCGNHKGPRRKIGLGIMSYGGSPDANKRDFPLDTEYLEKVVTFAEWLVANDYDVRLLIGDNRYDPPALEFTARMLTDRLSRNDRARVSDEPILSVQHLLSELAATDAVVATRFHTVLLALVLRKPVISISFHHKCSSLMSQMKLSNYCQHIQELDVDRLIAQFLDLEKNCQALGKKIGEQAKEFHAALERQDGVIFGTVASR